MTLKKAIFILITIGLISYFNSLFNPFIFDDNAQIVVNPYMKGVDKIIPILTGSAVNPSTNSVPAINYYYKPLFYITYNLIYNSFGSFAFPFHIFQLTIFILNAVIVFLIFSRFFKKDLGLFMSLIFLIHPINTETAGYIASLQDDLFMLFGLSALYLIIKNYLQKISISQLLLISLLLLLSVLSKVTGLLFFPLILCFEFFFSKKNLKIIVLFLALTFCLSLGINLLSAYHPIGSTFSHDLTPLWQRFINMPMIFFYYISTFFIPINLAFGQDWIIKKVNFYNFYAPFIFDILFFGVLIGIGLHFYKKHKKFFNAYLFFFFWFLLGLSAHSQIIPLDGTVACRWFYFPIVGLLGIIGVWIFSLEENNFFSQKIKKLKLFLYCLLVIVFCIMTIVRNSQWQSPLILLSNDIQYGKDSTNVNELYGDALLSANRDEDAKPYLEKSLSLNSKNIFTMQALGDLYVKERNFSKAKKLYLLALRYSLGTPQYIIYHKMIKIMLFHDRNAKDANILIKKLLNKYPNDRILITDFVISEYMLGNKTQAISLMKILYEHNQIPSYKALYNIFQKGDQLPYL